jgi:hypothetical protein
MPIMNIKGTAGIIFFAKKIGLLYDEGEKRNLLYMEIGVLCKK